MQEEMASEGAVEAENGIWTSSSCYTANIVLVGSTLFLNLIPIIDTVFEMIESVSSPLRRSLDHFHLLGLGISGWEYVFLWGCWYMGLRLGSFYVVVYGFF